MHKSHIIKVLFYNRNMETTLSLIEMGILFKKANYHNKLSHLLFKVNR